MYDITVVPLGPGSRDLLTLGALEALAAAPQVLLRTRRHGAVTELENRGIFFDTLDALHDQSADFDTFAQAAAERVKQQADKGPLCYAVSDPGQDESVRLLLNACGKRVTVLPGVTLEAPLLASFQPPRPLVITDATRLQVRDGQSPLCLTELDSPQLAGACKLLLLEHYDPDSKLYFFPPGEEGKRHGVTTTLEELDRQPRYDHTAGALLLPKPPFDKVRYDVQDLVRIMRQLRGPQGCPWDREQTHQSLGRYLVEEANEAAHAIAMEDWDALTDELGDVLLQVVFHAVVGEEFGTMTMGDIATAICSKLIRRHTHIFGEDKADTPQQVSDNWEKIKQQERGEQSLAQKMRRQPASLPPLLRAVKVQEIARRVGFDWQDPLDALEKVHEEAGELMEAHHKGQDVREELGDLFFACVNVSRLLDTNPDEVVTMATEKFMNRFEWMEEALQSEEISRECLTLEEWDVYWERSKQALK